MSAEIINELILSANLEGLFFDDGPILIIFLMGLLQANHILTGKGERKYDLLVCTYKKMAGESKQLEAEMFCALTMPRLVRQIKKLCFYVSNGKTSNTIFF